jgi:hypothetical protein
MMRRLGEETAQSAIGPKTRNTILILGFGLSAALLLVTVYPRQQ